VASITLRSGTDDVQEQLGQADGAGVKLIHDKPFEGAAGNWSLSSKINIRGAD